MQIICLGDSITDCNHLFEDFPLGNGYVQMLSEMFQKHTINFVKDRLECVLCCDIADRYQ